jgi:hypothetical protein
VGLYWAEECPVRVECADAVERDRVAVSVWDQQWATARQRFSFCTAENVQRSLDRQSFTLLFADRLSAPTEPKALREEATLQALVADIETPSTLRQFLAFVGSGVGSLRTMPLFVQAWLSCSRGALSRDALDYLASLIANEAPACQDLRRLKRRVFTISNGARPVASDPFAVLDLFAGKLARVVAVEDASVENWTRLAWESDAVRLLDSVSSGASGVRPPFSTGGHAVGEALQGIILSLLPTLVTPATLEVVARSRPDQLLPVLTARQDPKLWAAWASLEEPLIASVVGRADLSAWTIEDLITAVTVLLHGDPPRLNVITEIVEDGGDAALEALIQNLEREPQAARALPWRDLLQRQAVKTASLLENESSPARIAVLAAIVSPDKLPKHVDKSAWSTALLRPHSGDVAAIGYLIGRRSADGDGRRVGAQSYARLYALLASGLADNVWDLMNRRVAGKPNDLDHCRRLANDWSKGLRSVAPSDVDQLLAIADSIDVRAAAAARDALDTQGNESLAKRLGDLLKW